MRHYCPVCQSDTQYERGPVQDGAQLWICTGCAKPPHAGMRSTALVYDGAGRLLDRRPGRIRAA